MVSGSQYVRHTGCMHTSNRLYKYNTIHINILVIRGTGTEEAVLAGVLQSVSQGVTLRQDRKPEASDWHVGMGLQGRGLHPLTWQMRSRAKQSGNTPCRRVALRVPAVQTLGYGGCTDLSQTSAQWLRSSARRTCLAFSASGPALLTFLSCNVCFRTIDCFPVQQVGAQDGRPRTAPAQCYHVQDERHRTAPAG